MTTDEGTTQDGDQARQIEDEAHLLDLASLQDVALWLLSAAGAGVIGNKATEVLRAVRKRFGSDRVEELRERVYEEMKKLRGKRTLSNRDLRLRVERIFDEYDA